MALETLNNTEKWGQKIQVELFVPSKNRSSKKSNIYIKNFPKTMDQAKIEKFLVDHLEPLGKVTCKGVYNKEINGDKKFFAFLAYEEEVQAQTAIEKYNKHKFEGDEEKTELYIGFA